MNIYRLIMTWYPLKINPLCNYLSSEIMRMASRKAKLISQDKEKS
jgi:hypothetical protein